MATKFLKIQSSGALTSKELDCAMLRFENTDKAFNHGSTPANINTAAKVKKHLIVLDLGGADVASNKYICFNFGTANRADAAVAADMEGGLTNKTVIHVDVANSFTNTSTFNDLLTALKTSLDAELLYHPNIKSEMHTATNDKKLMVWNASQSGVDIDRPKWLIVSTDAATPNLANNALVTTTGGSGAYASYVETEQFDEAAPSSGATYYLNANKTLVGYGTGVKEQFTAANNATGVYYTDKQNSVVYIKCDTTFILQDGSSDGDVGIGYAEKCARMVNSLRTSETVVTAKNANKTVNGVSIVDTNNPQDSRFFDEMVNDGLFPGGSTGYPTELRDDFLGNRETTTASALTPTLVNAGTATNNATGETDNESQVVNRAFVKSSKAVVELALPTNLETGRQHHILTY